MLNKEEYDKVQKQFKDKGVKRVPFFIASESSVKSFITLVGIGRLLTFLNLGYFTLCGANIFLGKLGQPGLLYLCTGGVTLLNGMYHYLLKKSRRTAILKLEWDV